MEKEFSENITQWPPCVVFARSGRGYHTAQAIAHAQCSPTPLPIVKSHV